MCTNTSRIRRSSSTKVRRQALHHATERTESKPSVADRFRPWSLRGAEHGRASLALCPARQSQASARLNLPSARTHSAAHPICFASVSFSPQQQPSQRRESAVALANDSSPSPLLHHHSSSTATPATHRVHQCPLTELGKLQRHASARRSSAANPIIVAPPPQFTSRSVS